jgi:hypothetical protein
LEKEKIFVALFFGKKDNLLLPKLYQMVSKADFNFIVKATLKHHLKNDKFKIHIYTDLTPLLDIKRGYITSDESVQRNIVFAEEDGFLYDWIENLSKSVRGMVVKQIVVSRLEECIDVLKNGEKDIEVKNQYPADFIIQQLMGNVLQNALQSSITSNLASQQISTLIPDIKETITDIEEEQQTLSVTKATKNSLSKFRGSSIADMGRG